MSADELKAKGNAAFSAGQHEEAIKWFSQAIDVAPSNHVLYSNRSASNAALKRWDDALADARKCTELNPTWAKGFSRLGAALHGLGKLADAAAAYAQGLEVDPENAQLKEAAADLSRAIKLRVTMAGASAPRDESGLAPVAAMLSDPNMMALLVTNPKTRPFLQQPDFLDKLREVQNQPETLSKHAADPRVRVVLEEVLGVKLMSQEDVMRQEAERDAKLAEERKRREAEAAEKARREEEERLRREEESMTPEQKEAKKRRQEAQGLKEEGNACYKKREFARAVELYTKAMELDDSDVSFLTNRAAVHLETGDLEACIRDSDEAVQRGRELRADYKLIARALARKGTALMRSGRMEDAREVLNKSLTEHRTADALKKLQECERAIKTAAEEAYVDLDKCREEKEKGNAAFQQQDFPTAVNHYSEALRRGPPSHNDEAHKLFSNRAACYTKLGAWSEGLKDADKCIELAPSFIKGYIRKANLLFLMKDYDEALETYRAGLAVDEGDAELQEGMHRTIRQISMVNSGQLGEEELKRRQEKAMANPEIQNIMSDPVMRQVLQDLGQDPKSAQKHLGNPEIMRKVNVLARAGILRMA
ncbi:unnamed protein product [Pedinophyceae sp. YPF-701]|nr:unnamed protein product [Pedinophyceae sp. YPF-701]